MLETTTYQDKETTNIPGSFGKQCWRLVAKKDIFMGIEPTMVCQEPQKGRRVFIWWGSEASGEAAV